MDQERILKLIHALSGPTMTFRFWNALVGRKGRELAMERAAAKIDAAVMQYAKERKNSHDIG
jgi:hypothetical protein